jgi:steroid delta-isomerase-like uncharacterized protein
MSVEENIALMNRWFQEVWNEGRVQTIYDLLDENAIGIGQDPDGAIHGPAGCVFLFNRLRGAFPDMKFTLEDVFGSGDKVVVRWSAAMTHTGDYLGIPATKKTVRISGITITQIEKGKIVQGWDNWGQLGLMQQIQATAKAAAA